MNYSGYPFFIRNSVIGGSYYSSNVGFQYNGNLYYLKVDINEINEPTNPVNDENHANLLEIFGSSKCTTGIDNDTNTDYTECIDNDINLRVYTTAGSIGAFRDDFACIINDRILSCQYFI